MQDHTGVIDPHSDETYMVRVAAGDSAALDLLYTRYGRIVYGLSLRILTNAEHAEDIVQETFWRVWSRSATFQAGSGQFAPWLFGIARNLCIDELRRRRSRPTANAGSDEELHMLPDEGRSVEALTLESERRRLISSALADLPADQREVIQLAYFAGLSQREIAEHLNNPLGTVKTRIRLGLQKLKGLLQHQGISLEDR